MVVDCIQTGEVKYLRTELRGDIYDRLEFFAKSLGTATGKYNFSVAIERLLDLIPMYQKIMELDQRIACLESNSFEPKPVEKEIEKREKPKDVLTLLGGHKIEDEKIES
jgi:hypothetical protein